MIQVIKSNERHHANFGWLDTHWHFSFDTYYDPENVHWGALRVFNDDVIEPGQGFGMHGHRDMEIITYVLEGELEHRDSQGNRGVVHPGEVQVMSAGTGIRHSEFNPSGEKPLHLLQIWVLPRTRGLQPRWQQRQFTSAERNGKLRAVVSSGDIPGTLRIDQDAQVYISRLKAGEEGAHQSRAGRRAYLFVISGSVSLNGFLLAAGDQARMADEKELKIQAKQDSELILLDLPEVEELALQRR
jgi:hypothetical protein